MLLCFLYVSQESTFSKNKQHDIILWTTERWQGHWAAWHGCKGALEQNTGWGRTGREGKITLWFALILNLVCLFNCTVGRGSGCEENDGESIFVPWFHHIPRHFSHLSQLPKWFIQHGLLLIHQSLTYGREEEICPLTDINDYLAIQTSDFTFTNITFKISNVWMLNKTYKSDCAYSSTCLIVFFSFSGPLSFQLVPSFLRLCYWLCGAWWPCTHDLFPDCRGLNFYASAALPSNLEVRGSRVRRSQVFGEVNVFLPADWEREVPIC